MPLPGGASGKAGIRYEGLWTVRCMIRVMQGEAEWIWLEPPGEEGAGVEFTVSTPSGTEYHQVKRQKTGMGRWSLSSLSSEGVLTHFYQKLDDPSAACVFVSAHAADALEELASRARDAGSWEEFNRAFLCSDQWSTEFANLRTRWNLSGREDSYQRVRRVFVRTYDESSLMEDIHDRLEGLVNADPATVADILSNMALARLHQTLTAADIWGRLSSRGLSRQTWAQDQSITDTIAELNKTYVAGIQPVGIGGEVVPRSEVGEILHHFGAEDTGNIALVTGRAGVGKSSVISQVLGCVNELGWPLLALRVDRLEPCLAPRDVGRQLGLPASPATVLDSISGGKDCLLVIDQLDAISLASGRNPEFFDCIGALLEQARHYPNMRVLTACRKFDVDNDHRFRQIVGDKGIAKEFPVGLFDEETTRDLVTRMGIDATKLDPRQIDLLSLPVHLRLLSEATSDNNLDSMGFRSAKDLYDRFWDFKQQNLRRSHIDTVQSLDAIHAVIDHMNKNEVLSAPASLLDVYPDVAALLVSENILTKDGSRISLFHEGFLDYMFARRMVSTDFDLLSYVRERGQGMFLRSQIRQILLHQRDTSPMGALRNVHAILATDDIRTHLKTIVLALLGAVDDPKKEEWEVIEPLLGSNLSRHFWGAIYQSLPWFDLLDSTGVIERWLTDPSRVDQAVWLLMGVQKSRSARAAELLASFINSPESWNHRLSSLIALADIGASREFFDFVLSAVEAGVLDKLLKPTDVNSDAWHLIKPLVVSNPEWACELLAAYCHRLVCLAVSEGDTNPFPDRVDRHRTGSQVMLESAQAAPQKYAELLLPILVEILAVNTDRTGDPPWPDMVWNSGIYSDLNGLDDSFLESMVSAMRGLAQQEPDKFTTYAGALRPLEFLTIKNLLFRSYEAHGRFFADEAIEYLLVHPNSLAADDRSSSHWVTRQLLEATTPHCSPENLARLEQAVLDYYPGYELEPSNRWWRGCAQLTLLEGIQASRLSDNGRRRLQELRRKFSGRLPSEPKPFEGGFVDSPIPADSARKMSDQDWLGAMKAHSTRRQFSEATGSLVGGPLELSRELESLTKEDPARFANLIHSIPDDANIAYFEAILRGIAGSSLDSAAVVAACLRCHKIPDRPLGRCITRRLEHLPDFQLPVEALEMVAWYATENTDAVRELSIYRPGRTTSSHGEDLLNAGINSVRGLAAETIGQLISEDPSHLAFFEPYVRVMVNDDSVAVRTCVAHALLSVLRHDRDLAVELFVTLCDADERLLATHYVEFFLKYAVKTHYQQLEPTLSRMIESDIEEVATVGARQVCLASLENGEAMPLAGRCASGSKALRLGMAEVYSANLKLSAFRSQCEEMLGRLFADPEAEVRQAAAWCFRQLEGEDARGFQGLIETYIHSPAFTPARGVLISTLDKTTAPIPDIILSTSERFFDLVGEDAGDSRTSAASGSTYLAKLVVRVYSRAIDPSVKSRCLDLIDKMVLLGALGLDEATAAFER